MASWATVAAGGCVPTIPEIFDNMPANYNAGVLSSPRSYYFSVGEDKYTVQLTPDSCTVEPGKTLDRCDCVLKTTPKLFKKMVLKGKMPGPIDIARGLIKTNDPAALAQLRDLFRF
jgi:long-chain acyl-CoA synthetase